jgi:hypothetical protein
MSRYQFPFAACGMQADEIRPSRASIVRLILLVRPKAMHNLEVWLTPSRLEIQQGHSIHSD